jgi:hypothetical protein
MTIKQFSFPKLKKLFETGPLRDYQDAKNYLDSYIIPLTIGSHAKIENNKIEMINHDTFS